MPTKNYVSDYTQEKYSQADFVRLIEHRIRKDLRLHQSIDVKATYTLCASTLLTTKVLQTLLSHIFQGRLAIELVNEPTENTLHPDCLEEFVAERLAIFTQGDSLTLLTQKKLHPLRTVTLHECQELATIFELTGDLPVLDAVDTSRFVTHLQEQYSQTKTSLLKSFLALEASLSEKSSKN